MVITLDFESNDPGSNPGRDYFSRRLCRRDPRPRRAAHVPYSCIGLLVLSVPVVLLIASCTSYTELCRTLPRPLRPRRPPVLGHGSGRRSYVLSVPVVLLIASCLFSVVVVVVLVVIIVVVVVVVSVESVSSPVVLVVFVVIASVVIVVYVACSWSCTSRSPAHLIGWLSSSSCTSDQRFRPRHPRPRRRGARPV